MAQFKIIESDKRSFFTDDTLERNNRNNILGNKTAFTRIRKDDEIQETNLKLQKDYRNSTSEWENLNEDMDKVTQDFYELSGIYYGMNDYYEEVDEPFAQANNITYDPGGAYQKEFSGITSLGHAKAKKDWILGKMNDWFEKNPQEKGSPQGGFRGYDYYFNLRKQELAELEKEQAIQQIYNDGSTTFPQFLGSAQGIFSDPLIWETLPLSLATGGTGGTLLGVARIALAEAAIAGLTEVAIQSKVVPYNKSLGSEYGWREASATIAMAAGGGFIATAGLAGTITGLGKSYTSILNKTKLGKAKNLAKEINKLIDEAPVKDEEFADRLIKYINGEIGKFTTSEKRILLQSIPNAQKSDTAKVAETILQGDELIDETNPLQNTSAGKQEHIERIHKAGDSLFSEGQIKINEEPRTAIDYDKNFDSDYNVYREVRLDPDEIELEPKVFQFKTVEVDPETGVSPKLKGITEWDQDAANVVMVFEYADGRKVIADGHQRLALAKRIKAMVKQKPYLLATVRREVDGHTPEETMVAAMMLNVHQGTANATDVAKILRLRPDYIQAIKGKISPRSILWDNAQGLSKLSPESWQYYLNNKVPDNIAAAVGNLVEDVDLQIQVMDYIIKNNFNNINQIKLAIQDIISQGTTTREVQDLFGTQTIKELLIKERAEVLDKAIRDLKRDKSIASFLVSNEEKIVKKGKNKLDGQFNQQVLDESAFAIEKIIKLANMKGEISEELNIAARLFKDGDKQGAVRTFKEAVATAIRKGDLDRIAPGGSERTTLSEGYTQTQPKKPKPQEITKSLENNAEPHNGDLVYKNAKDELDTTIDEQINKIFGQTSSSGIKPGDLKTSATSTADDISQAEVSGLLETTTAPPSAVLANATDIPLKSRIEVTNSIGEISSISKLLIHHITDDINELYSMANKSIKSIEIDLQNIANSYKNSKVITNIKKRETLLSNIQKKIDDGNKAATAANEPDIARGTIVLDQLSDIPKVLDDIKNKNKIVRIKNHFNNPKDGYRAIHVQLVTKDGLGFELQLHHKDLFKLYKKHRTEPGGYAERKAKGKQRLTPEELEKFDQKVLKDTEELDRTFNKTAAQEDFALIDQEYQVVVGVTEEGVQTQSVRDILSDLENDEAIINRLASCPGIK